MYSFISLNVKCPACGASLMDPGHLVDNKPSIHMMMQYDEQQGHVRLSSIYDSYNFIADFEVPAGKIAHFYCPSCNSQLTSKQPCTHCSAEMVPLYLDMGGKVSFCARRGCKNHKIEFDDLSTALHKFHESFGHEDAFSRKTGSSSGNAQHHKPDHELSAEHQEIISTGTFLHAYCPHCRRSLIEDDMLKLKVKKGEEGFVLLSPYLNVFTSKSTVYLPEDQAIDELHCCHCDKDLIAHGKKCGKCGSAAARIAVSARTKLIDFYICTKKGCRWHGLDEDDMFDIKLDDSPEW